VRFLDPRHLGKSVPLLSYPQKQGPSQVFDNYMLVTPAKQSLRCPHAVGFRRREFQTFVGYLQFQSSISLPLRDFSSISLNYCRSRIKPRQGDVSPGQTPTVDAPPSQRDRAMANGISSQLRELKTCPFPSLLPLRQSASHYSLVTALFFLDLSWAEVAVLRATHLRPRSTDRFSPYLFRRPFTGQNFGTSNRNRNRAATINILQCRAPSPVSRE
jgi:hypothetical protein